MKTILIDPYVKTVTEHEYDGSLKQMYKLLDCDLVECVYSNDEGNSLFPTFGDCLFVDEEGLLKFGQEYFIIDGKPLAGRAMTVGTDDDGNTTDSKVTVEDLTARVIWADHAAVRDHCAKRGF